MANVRGTHEQLDPETGVAMKRLYDDTIDLGAHPNQGGVASALVIDESRPDATTVKVGMMNSGTLSALVALKAAVDVAVGSAKTADLIYPERFRNAAVDREIDRLARHSAEVFGRRASAEKARLWAGTHSAGQ